MAGGRLYLATAVVLAAFAAGFLVQFHQEDRLNVLENELAALHKQGDPASPDTVARSELQQLGARVDGLAVRLETIMENNGGLSRVRQALSDQHATIESLSRRMEQLERNPKLRQRSGDVDDNGKTDMGPGGVN